MGKCHQASDASFARLPRLKPILSHSSSIRPALALSSTLTPILGCNLENEAGEETRSFQSLAGVQRLQDDPITLTCRPRDVLRLTMLLPTYFHRPDNLLTFRSLTLSCSFAPVASNHCASHIAQYRTPIHRREQSKQLWPPKATTTSMRVSPRKTPPTRYPFAMFTNRHSVSAVAQLCSKVKVLSW